MQPMDYIEKIVGKENFEGFIKEFKSALQSVEKQNEKKEVDITVKGGDDFSGISAETFSITKDRYNEYITEEKDYMKDAVSIMTIKINAKDVSSLPTLQSLIESKKDMLKGIKFIQEKGNKITIHTRISGTSIFVDAVFKDELINKGLQEIEIDFGEFHTLAAAFKTGFKPGEFFDLSFDELPIIILNIFISVKGTLTNGRYFGTALLKALETVHVTNEIIQKKIKKVKLLITTMNAFNKLNFNFEYYPKQLLVASIPAIKHITYGKEPSEELEEFKIMVTQLGEPFVKPVLEELQLLELIKIINFDEITVSIVPSFQKWTRSLT